MCLNLHKPSHYTSSVVSNMLWCFRVQTSEPPEKHRIMNDNKEIVLKFTAENIKDLQQTITDSNRN